MRDLEAVTSYSAKAIKHFLASRIGPSPTSTMRRPFKRSKDYRR